MLPADDYLPIHQPPRHVAIHPLSWSAIKY